MPDGFEKLRLQVVRRNQPKERGLWIEIARDQGRLEFIAVLKHNASGPPICDFHVIHFGIRPESGAVSAPGCRNRVRDGAHPAADKAPETALAVYTAHAVMHQDVCRSRRPWAAIRSDDRIRRERDLNLVRFKPFIEEIGGALRENLHEADHLLWLEPTHPAK